MHSKDGWQLAIFVGLLALLRRPVGRYLTQVLDARGRTWLDPVLRPVERVTYRFMAVDPLREHDWRGYTLALLLFSLVTTAFTYLVLRCQHLLPLNPQGLGPVPADLAFNTAVSFVTNTNWQSYGGESTLSYFSQMVALALHNFTSAAAGLGVAGALVRALARHSVHTVGNFWADLVRTTLYLLLPACLVFAVVLVSQGMIQNFRPYTIARLMEPARAAGAESLVTQQVIVQGPMASQVAVKMLGTNGGGYANANAAHPFENPTPLSNFLQLLAIFVLGAGLTHHLGSATGHPAHGRAVWWAMMTLFLAGVLACWWAEARGNPIHHALGVVAADGNLEGKEVRFGVFGSALFATVTTAASCGAVNAMHDSFTPLGGLVALFNIELGEVVVGGVGAGLYGMLVFVVLTVFIAGLMVGRTPEYLGKRIQAREVQLCLLALLAVTIPILAFTAWAAVSPRGTAGLNNAGPHGLTEMLYAFSSATGNNGSAFAGLGTNTPWYNVTLALAMFAGRFFMIIPVMALAGSLARQRITPPGPGTFPVSGATFVVLLLGTVVLVGALNFLPALALGPIVEHFLNAAGRVF